MISGLVLSRVAYSRLSAANIHLCQEEPSRFPVKLRIETEIDEKHTYDFDLAGWPPLSSGEGEAARLCCWTTDPTRKMSSSTDLETDSAVAPLAVHILSRVTTSLSWPLALPASFSGSMTGRMVMKNGFDHTRQIPEDRRLIAWKDFSSTTSRGATWGPDYVHGLLFATVRRNRNRALAALPDESPALSSFETMADSVKVFPYTASGYQLYSKKRIPCFRRTRREERNISGLLPRLHSVICPNPNGGHISKEQ